MSDCRVAALSLESAAREENLMAPGEEAMGRSVIVLDRQGLFNKRPWALAASAGIAMKT
jgi:hypothetical protein